jgi:hypothetical protein
MRIASDGGGMVGIGIDSPSARLHIGAGGSNDGVRVDSASEDGVHVHSAGNPRKLITSNAKNGFEVAGAEGHGLFIGRANNDGVSVLSAGDDGVEVHEANYGVYVRKANKIGLLVYADDFAGYFGGNVLITGTCSGCTMAAFARNTGQTMLEPGDVVAVRGVSHPDIQGVPVVMDVGLASDQDAVTGIVAGRAELQDVEDEAGLHNEEKEGEAIQRLIPREGPAKPGDYVNIIIYGLVQVKASAIAAPIKPGTRRLTAADEVGYARTLRTVEVQGVQVAESAPVIGVALEELEAGQDLIWVLVNPQ